MQEIASDLSQTMLNKIQLQKDVHRPGKFNLALLCLLASGFLVSLSICHSQKRLRFYLILLFG